MHPDTTSNSREHLMILSISLAMFMSSLDGTIVNIALPTISAAFNISSSAVSWVASAYLLVMAGCVLIFGKISDMVGFKKIFISGFAIFTLGSLTCGVLPDLLNSFPSLVGSRIFQAIGGAMITAIAPAMVTAYISDTMRGKAMGVIMTMAALGTAIGPTIGGFLTQYLSWHWIFFINVPVGIFTILLSYWALPRSGTSAKITSFDSKGAVLIFSGLTFLLYAMSEGHTAGWTSPIILAFLILAVLTLAGFVWYELRVPSPILEIRLFTEKSFLLMNLVLCLIFFSFSGINYLLPFYLEYVMKLDTATAGLVLTTLSIAMMLAGMVAGAVYTRKRGKVLCILAGIVLTAGYFLATQLRTSSTLSLVVLSLILIGLGLGLVMSPISSMILSSVSRTFQGMVSSLTSLERFAPLTLGIAFFNLVFVQGIISIAARHDVTMAAPKTLQMQVLAAGFDTTFFISFLIGVGILILTLLIKPKVHPDYLPESEEKIQGSQSEQQSL